MKKTNATADDVLSALLGAAILGAAAEQAKKPENDTETEKVATEELDRALELRKQYEAFIEAGFTEQQATAFIIAILS